MNISTNKMIELRFGVNWPVHSGSTLDFVKESSPDFLIYRMPGGSSGESRQFEEKHNDYFQTVADKIQLFAKDYDTPAMVVDESYLDCLATQLRASSLLSSSGFFTPVWGDHLDERIFNVMNNYTNSRFEIIFPYMPDSDFYLDVMDSCLTSLKYSTWFSPSDVFGADGDVLDKVIPNVRFLSVPWLFEDGLLEGLDQDKYFNTICRVFSESKYQQINIFFHLADVDKSKEQQFKQFERKREITLRKLNNHAGGITELS